MADPRSESIVPDQNILASIGMITEEVNRLTEAPEAKNFRLGHGAKKSNVYQNLTRFVYSYDFGLSGFAQGQGADVGQVKIEDPV